ncbi:uncharacterized protein [Lepeophtheirus salmonis]|uniref:uncharacterized protein n=1 Tax=Lepeophtheirus salmonis TaxID=72036 RepID=UPI001AEB36F0|nr:uncharacterized protein LOC121113973 isoform X2 [Lepeophtheirus salmonis]
MEFFCNHNNYKRKPGSGTLSPISSDNDGNLRSPNRVLPQITSNQPLHTPLPVLKNGLTHPEPYVILPTVVFDIPESVLPWIEIRKKEERKNRDLWNGSASLRAGVTDEIIHDFLHDKILNILSRLTAERRATKKVEEQWLGWVEEHVVTFTVVQFVERMIWDSIRKTAIKRHRAKPLNKNYFEDLDSGREIRQILLQNYPNPPEKNKLPILERLPLKEIILHFQIASVLRSRKESFVIRKMHEMIITQVACKTLFNELYKHIEKDMNKIDDIEKVVNPPITKWNTKI